MKEQTPSVLDKDTQRRVFNQITATTSRASHDDLGVQFRQLQATQEGLKESSAGVPDRESIRDPLWLRILGGLLTLGTFITASIVVVQTIMFTFHWQSWLALLLTGGPLGLLAYLKWRREQKAWIARMGWDKKQ